MVRISVSPVCRAELRPRASACPARTSADSSARSSVRGAPSRSRRARGLFFPRGLSSTHFLLRLGNASKPPLSLRPKHQLLETRPVTVCFVFGEGIPAICHEQALP